MHPRSASAAGIKPKSLKQIRSAASQKTAAASATRPASLAGTLYRASFAYNQDKPGEFSFGIGESLTCVSQVDQNWLLCKNAKGQEGLAPLNFLEAVTGLSGKASPSRVETQMATPGLSVGGMVKGLHSYQQAGSKFNFHKGDLMEVIEIVDQNWVRARRFDAGNCLEGLAPLNYVSVESSE